MLRIAQTFGGNAINDGTNYRAVVLNPNSLPAAQPVFLAQPNADAEDAGLYTVEAHTVVLSIRIQNYANRQSLIAQLKRWFKRGTYGDLVVTYSDEALNYYKPCRAINLVQDPEAPMYFIATLNTGWTAWRAVTADTYVWNLTGTGGNYTLNLAGDDETPLSVTLSMSAPPGGYAYQKPYALLNAPQTVKALGYGPWCITLDTAALIADNGNKCQINQVGGITAGATTIPYDTVTGAIPSAGMGYVGTEQIRWTGKTGTTSGNLTGVVRGIGGTSAASQADNAEIKLSYVLANGDDLRVFLDGKEANRWIASMNNANTKVWFNVTINAGFQLLLRTAIASGGSISYIEFAQTPDSLSALQSMPDEGILVHGTEWIKYRGKDLKNYRLAVTARGVLGSTLQAHASNDVFIYMEHVVVVCYGNAVAVNPASSDARYDDRKPLFRLDSSSNSSWVYDATSNFYDLLMTGRTGGFTPQLLAGTGGKNTVNYLYKQLAAIGDPAMGMAMESYIKGIGYVSEKATLAWMLYRACGINTTTTTGQKYRSGTSFPATAALQIAADGAAYSNIWNESSPGSASVWTALGTHSADAMSSVRWMRFLFDGSVAAGAAEKARFEILTLTVNFVSANLPTGTLSAQQINNHLNLTLSHGGNGDAIGLTMPMLTNLALVLDGEAHTVRYDGVNAHAALTLNDESRGTWLRLQKGDNALTAAAADVGTLQANLSWYRRRL
jgi:hypothetical protein